MNLMRPDPARRARRLAYDRDAIVWLALVLAVFLVRSDLFGWWS